MEYKIEIYRNGITKAPGPEIFFLSQWDKEYLLYNYVFVIKGQGKIILCDTGCGNISDVNEMLFKEFAGKISFEMPKDEKIDAILYKAKIDPLNVDYILLTHLHHDHAGNLGIFKNAKIVLSETGWLEYMKKDKPYFYDNALYPKEPIKYLSASLSDKLILVKNEKEILPGITAFWVGGHTPCCMAYQISTKNGRAVITSDVAFLVKNISDNKPIGLFYNLFEVFEAYKKIKDKADIILTSHDPEIIEKRFTNKEL